MTNNGSGHERPRDGRKNRRGLIAIIAVFAAALIAIFIWGRGLAPTDKEGDLNATGVEGSNQSQRRSP